MSSRGALEKCREVFQTALGFFGDDEEQVEKAQAVFAAFAKMETRLKEYERARVIYKVRLVSSTPLKLFCHATSPLVCSIPPPSLQVRLPICCIHKVRKAAW